MAAVLQRVRTFGSRPKTQPKLTSENIHQFLNDEYFAEAAQRQAKDRERYLMGQNVAGVGAVVTAVVFVVCFVMLVIYCRMQPRIPKVEIVTAKFNYIIMKDLSAAELAQQAASGTGNYFAAYFNFSITYTLSYENPNKHVDFYNDYLRIKPFYFGFQLGDARSTPFTQDRMSASLIKVNIIQQRLPVPLKVNYSIKRDIVAKTLTFIIHTVLKARMSTVLGMKSPLFWITVRCDITMISGVITRKVCTNASTVL